MTKNDEILHFLKDACGKPVSGEDISQRLGITRAAVWKEIEALRELGYEIEAQTNQGYSLTGIPDKLFADEILDGLETEFMGKPLLSYDEIDSTNDAVFKMGEDGVPEGAAVFAEFQKKGRGRLGRSWISSKGKSVLFSYLLRPTLSPAQISRVTLVAGVSAVRACRRITGKEIGIKWPNDIYFQNRKIGGILTEMSAESDRINFVVVGIGLNVNSSPEDLPEGSMALCEIAGHQIARIVFSQTLLREIEADYVRLKKGLFKELAEEWETYSVTTGQRVSARLLDRTVEGQAVGIDADGALWIRKDNGLQERILSGDIQHLRPSLK